MSLESVIPVSGLPRTGKPPNGEEFWYATDNLKDYRKRGGHPLYGERDIVYRFNSFGYRCPEFDHDVDIRMISIGCSHTFGVGLPQAALFHELFANRLRRELGKTVVNWNLAQPGASCDYLARMLHLAVPQLNPDIVLILFPHPGRREYLSVQGRVIFYNPNFVAPDPASAEINSHFSSLSSTYNNQINFYLNYRSIACLLADRYWFCSFARPEYAADVSEYVDSTRYTAPVPLLDHARDDSHLGPRTQQAIYECFWTRFVETGGLDALVHQGQPSQAPEGGLR